MAKSYDQLDAKNKAAVDKFLGKSGGGSSGGSSGGSHGGGSSHTSEGGLADQAKMLAGLIGTPQESWARQQASAIGLKDYDLVPFMKSRQLNNVTGNSLTPNTPTLSAGLIPDAPKLNIDPYKPYKYQEFEYTPPDYSITSDPKGTSFIPTARAKDRWQQQEQLNAAEHLNQYNALVNQENTLQDQWYKQANLGLQNQQMMMPYLMPTVGQQLQQNQWQMEWGANPQSQPWYMDYQKQLADLGISQAKKDLAKPYFAPSSSSGGSIPQWKDTQNKSAEADQYLRQNISKFKRPVDFVAQVKRNYEAGTVPKYVYDYVKEYMTKNYDPYETLDGYTSKKDTPAPPVTNLADFRKLGG